MREDGIDFRPDHPVAEIRSWSSPPPASRTRRDVWRDRFDVARYVFAILAALWMLAGVTGLPVGGDSRFQAWLLLGPFGVFAGIALLSCVTYWTLKLPPWKEQGS